MTNPAAGVCDIKPEYIVQRPLQPDTKTNVDLLGKHKLEASLDDESNHVDNKKQKIEDNKSKTKKKGQNKGRPKAYRDEKDCKLCPSIVNVASTDEKKECQFNNCKYIHDPLNYLKNKPKDIGDECHLYNIRGRCPRGLSCRYGSNHITEEGFNKVNQEKVALWKEDTRNFLQHDVQQKLQRRKYDFNFSERLVKHLDTRNKPKEKNDELTGGTEVKQEDSGKSESTEMKKQEAVKPSGVVTDEYLIKLLPKEKKLIDWKDKLYLSPLTTVGNLPFRRICKEYGADITCGEMALCESLLKGTKQEWALVKRHESEDLFGAQICGNNAFIISKVAQLLQENTELDFIDLNLGCPIDLIYKKGAGCGMMHRLNTLEASVRCASKLLTLPFTIKMRTGVYQDKKITHTIVPKMAELGASLITVHGRSREARYTRSADWEYVETCAKAAAPCPVFGNGDILCYEDYAERRKLAPTVQGVMIGRGALIKPWIFTEIKEQKVWDIRSSERFDILKKYTNYGLEHWGSDTQGVENTRRFMLEWLSFLYRYVPVGLLERPPQKINERPPSYFGRDDLETLMASWNCADWVKISEMLLGPVPDGFHFLPKHKANSY